MSINPQESRSSSMAPSLRHAKTLGFDIDYKRLLKNSRAAGRCWRVLLQRDHRGSGVSIRPLIDC